MTKRARARRPKAHLLLLHFLHLPLSRLLLPLPLLLLPLPLLLLPLPVLLLPGLLAARALLLVLAAAPLVLHLGGGGPAVLAALPLRQLAAERLADAALQLLHVDGGGRQQVEGRHLGGRSGCLPGTLPAARLAGRHACCTHTQT